MTVPRPRSTIVLAVLLAAALGLAACTGAQEPASPAAPPATATARPVGPAPTATPQPRATAIIPAPPPSPTPRATSTPAPVTVPAPGGTLEVRVTDAPDPKVTSVLVTVEGVAVHRADPGEWRTVVEGPASFDLIALSGVEAILGSDPLEAGRYTQVRLEVDAVEVTRAGQTEEAEVPSGTLKLVGAFVLEPGETTIITLDFEIEKSLVLRGGKPPLFKPVVKLLVGEPGAPGKPTVPLTGLPATAVPTQAATETAVPTPGETPTAAPTAAPTEVPTEALTETPTPAPTPTQDPTGELFLAIESPADLVDIVTEDSIEVSGRTRIDALVSVNDEVVDVDEDGRFSTTVALVEGDNLIEVIASVATGEEVGESLVIFYEPSGS